MENKMNEQQVPMPMRIYVRAKHHYANHRFIWSQNDSGNFTCIVLDLAGSEVYHYYYPQDYYEKLNEELKFNDYNLEWLGL